MTSNSAPRSAPPKPFAAWTLGMEEMQRRDAAFMGGDTTWWVYCDSETNAASTRITWKIKRKGDGMWPKPWGRPVEETAGPRSVTASERSSGSPAPMKPGATSEGLPVTPCRGPPGSW